MRLAFLVRHCDPHSGGAERYAYELIHQLSLRHECHVFCIDHVQMEQVTFHRFKPAWRKMRWLGLLQYARWAHTKIRSGCFDAIYSNENAGFGDIQMVHVRPVRHDLFHQDWVSRCLNGFKTMLSPRLWCYLGLEALRFMPRPGRFLVAPSEMTASQLIHDLHCHQSMVRTVLPGVHQAKFEGDRVEFRARLGLTDSDGLMLMVAHDLEKKGLQAVIQAMHLLPDEFHLLCTKDKEHQLHWEHQVLNAGLSERVHWLSKSETLDMAYESADVLVHPTKSDVYGMVLLEAMAHGLPVICTSAPYCGAAWSWTHKKQAWLLDSPDDIQSLVVGVSELRGNEGLRSRLIQSGRDLASQQIWANVANEIELLLEQSSRSNKAS